ncbi:MAG TPA: hypothetical protein VNT03_02640 [Baekduia sp.]|nr:hypothetical protein [Baekduia sp.]
MTDHAPTDEPREDDAREREATPPAPTSGPLSDPRLRPPDPAGTQPKYDPAALLPRRRVASTPGTLWAPPAEGAGEGDVQEEPEIRPRREDEPTAATELDAAPAYSRYSHRVQFALGALLAVGASAIVLLVAALVGDGRDPDTITLRSGPPWSSWRPVVTSGADAADQIAEHVGREYRLPNGQQLVAVTGGPMQIAGLPVTIAIQQPAAQGGNIDFVEGTGVLYRMCGVGGTDCAIKYGKPSPNRHMLLRREALELALYSFRYLGVTEAVVLLPPGQSQSKSASGQVVTTKSDPQALLFRRRQPDVRNAVAHPLNATLASKTPSVGSVSRSPDAAAVKTLTNPNLFNFRFQEANQDARAFLVLNPLPIR